MATLDHLSGSRVLFAAGLGGPIDDEYRSFGDPAEPRLLAERLDEGVELLRPPCSSLVRRCGSVAGATRPGHR
ncbi:hypothetical protein AB0C13_21925 [Streptomyces sp. NPDC049099]|uniref:hypothetical protein n=1 Tax=Streptomyces sp. NPDC049099 TaxID=3155768 RepID=UPI00343EF288